MAIDLEKVRADLFSDYGIAVSKDDPVLTFLATHDVILKQYGQHIEQAIAEGLEHYENTAINSNKQLLTDARDLANHMLNDSLQKIVDYVDNEKTRLQEAKKDNVIQAVEQNRTIGLLLIITSINSIILLGLLVLAVL